MDPETVDQNYAQLQQQGQQQYQQPQYQQGMGGGGTLQRFLGGGFGRAIVTGAGTVVLGISPDKPEKLAKFRDKEKLTFPLLSDPDHAVEQAYGAYGEKMMYGKKSVGVIRSTFVIDADGKVAQAQYGVKATGHVERLLRDLLPG